MNFLNFLNGSTSILAEYPLGYKPNLFEKILLKATKYLCYITYIFCLFVFWISGTNIALILLCAVLGFVGIKKLSTLIFIYERSGIKSLWISFVLVWAVALSLVLHLCKDTYLSLL